MSDVDKMIEDAARIFCAGCEDRPDASACERGNTKRWQDYAPMTRDALSSLGLPLETLAALKAGTWVAVPKEPTDAQCHAGLDSLSDEVWQADIPVAYSAFLSAAPAKPE